MSRRPRNRPSSRRGAVILCVGLCLGGSLPSQRASIQPGGEIEEAEHTEGERRRAPTVGDEPLASGRGGPLIDGREAVYNHPLDGNQHSWASASLHDNYKIIIGALLSFD